MVARIRQSERGDIGNDARCSRKRDRIHDLQLLVSKPDYALFAKDAKGAVHMDPREANRVCKVRLGERQRNRLASLIWKSVLHPSKQLKQQAIDVFLSGS